MARTMSAADRREAWNHTFDGDMDFNGELVALLQDRLAMIERIVGEERAAGPLASLLSGIDERHGDPNRAWRDRLEGMDPSDWGTLDLSRRLDGLRLYAQYGLTEESIPVDERAAHIENLIVEGESFVAAAESDRVVEGGNGTIARIVRLARARWCLDTGKGEIDPPSLALLAGVSEGRVRNVMSGNDRALENVGGRVPAASALAWLSDRPGYLPSLWQREDEPNEDDEENDDVAGAPFKDVVFVPREKNGTPFHPGHVRAGRYTIGHKGAERKVETFEEALKSLQTMPDPRWRRPDGKGGWGNVKGVEWVRIERAELERMGGPNA